MSFDETTKLVVLYLIYQLNALSCNAVTNCTFFILSFVICCDLQHLLQTTVDQVLFVPRPLNIGIFIVFAILNSGGGGGGGGVGV